ncbi:MAG: hypothetical protein JXR07_15585 [Reichenbachiella sp.]
MKNIITALFLTALFFECTQNEEPQNEIDNIEPGTPILTEMRSFMFGHSLIVHATESDETTVPHWMYLLSQQAGYSYGASGQYGFLPQHDDVPPISQWGFSQVPGIWESDIQPFSSADFNNVLITAGNFVQWQAPSINYYNEDTSPVTSTLTIIDWVLEQEPTAAIYIYENWPDMASYATEYPATRSEFDTYNDYTLGEFHSWWLEYQDTLIEARPDADIRMIPVGPILADLFTETNLNQIAVEDLYEDNDPHGRPTVYFLASLVTYMATFGVEAPVDFEIPDTVSSIVKDNYEDVVTFIWEELQAFNDGQNNSRVF